MSAFGDALQHDEGSLETTIRENCSWCNREWAWMLKEQGQYNAALEKANEAIRLRNDCSPVYNTRGCVYLRLQDKARAKKDFLVARSLEPPGTNDYATITKNLKLAQS